jgi:uncharacterized radical SAM superfamily protein
MRGADMETRGMLKNISVLNNIEITFELDKNTSLSAIDELINKELDITAVKHKEKRSLDANAYLWVLCQKIAEKINSNKDSVYIQLLGDAGVFTHTIVKPEAVERMKQQWRLVKELGEVRVNGKKGVQLQLYFGSSTYDTKEMSVLIDEAVRQAKELEIETLPPNQLASMKASWGV